MGRRVFTDMKPGVSIPLYLSTISTAAVVSSTNFILLSQAPYEDIQEEDCLMSPAWTKRT